MHNFVVTARKVALCPLDFYDTRACIDQALRAIGSGDRLFERNDENIFQHGSQKLLGRPSAWVATWLRIRFVEIGAT